VKTKYERRLLEKAKPISFAGQTSEIEMRGKCRDTKENTEEELEYI
jgi:hypothetical protein